MSDAHIDLTGTLRENLSGLIKTARIAGFILALVSYWAPWVAHKAAGLSLAEQDLAEFPKFMPQVRQHELLVVREGFYFPLLVLAVALVVWAANPPSPNGGEGVGVRAIQWLMRACAVALPLVSSVVNFFEPSEFQIQSTLSAIVVALIALTLWLRRIPIRVTQMALAVWFLLGALVPTAQFFYLKPALDAIYHQPLMIGWGLWAGLFGFGLLAISTADRGRQPAA